MDFLEITRIYYGRKARKTGEFSPFWGFYPKPSPIPSSPRLLSIFIKCKNNPKYFAKTP